jgi:hypothetical protein
MRLEKFEPSQQSIGDNHRFWGKVWQYGSRKHKEPFENWFAVNWEIWMIIQQDMSVYSLIIYNWDLKLETQFGKRIWDKF